MAPCAASLIEQHHRPDRLQGGLSAVCTELLDFAGDEMYFTGARDLAGATFLDAQLAFRESTVIGIVGGCGLELNPPAQRVIDPDDRLILIAQDDSLIEVGQPGAVEDSIIGDLAAEPKPPERILVLGHNSNLRWILDDVGKYVAPASAVHVVTDAAPPGIFRDGLEVTVDRADTTSRSVLERSTWEPSTTSSSSPIGTPWIPKRRLQDARHPAPPARHRRQGQARHQHRREMIDDRNRRVGRDHARPTTSSSATAS